MEVIQKKVEALIPYIRNAKEHPDHQIKLIAGSIKEFGFNSPILIDQSNMIIAGHGRLLAAKLIGLEEVPVIILSHLTKVEQQAYILADNKLSMLTGFNMELLHYEFESIMEEEIDLTGLGFNQDEIDEAMSVFDNDPEGSDGCDPNCEGNGNGEVKQLQKLKSMDKIDLGVHCLVCGGNDIKTCELMINLYCKIKKVDQIKINGQEISWSSYGEMG